jgi:hypothetical protein
VRDHRHADVGEQPQRSHRRQPISIATRAGDEHLVRNVTDECRRSGPHHALRTRRDVGIVVPRADVFGHLGFFAQHVRSCDADDVPFRSDNIERAVIGEIRNDESGKSPERLLVVERLRQREGRFGEKRVSLRRSGGELFCVLAIRNIAGDFRGADHPARGIENGRDAQRDGHEPAVTRSPDGLEVFNALACANRREHRIFFDLSIVGNEPPDGRSNHFVRGIPEHALGRLVPRQHDPVEVFADDGIVRRLHNRGQPPCDRVRALCHVPQTTICASHYRSVPIQYNSTASGIGLATS